MKITSMEIFKCYGSPPVKGNNEVFIVVVPKINTDAGIYGFGERACAWRRRFGGRWRAEGFLPKNIGKDPMNVEGYGSCSFSGNYGKRGRRRYLFTAERDRHTLVGIRQSYGRPVLSASRRHYDSEMRALCQQFC